ncbi:RrF2 family transcriptional regulator [Lysinibacter cavernae]|uniref:Rrf2 family nitric oxide-sensitive transcriptional repressor n=1 Tax=Lysinibacter cavernae TaxID=1640652 RepID=A0A7X5R2K2_9MICO|nr:Rrf2 family transcriptional regulator [Lysinibacter cavernae]NIH54513.1 Rrf2 family nitric oxide-sensitive transcriptional repressor [Lysinibacter cavernae]
MKISTFADVGLRVLLVLTAAPEGTQLTSHQLAEAVGSPRNHVSKTLTRLGELGLLDVVRGRNGGVRISAAGMTATVGQVLRELDNKPDIAVCHSDHGNCPLIGDCRLRFALRDAQEAFFAALDGIVISSLPTPAQVNPVFASIGLRPMA